MEYMPVDLRLVSITCGFHTILKHSSTCARKRICNHRRRYEVVRMEYEQILRIVHGALACAIKVTDHIDERPWSTRSVNPGLS